MRVPALRHLRPLPLVGLALSLIASCSPRGFNQRTAPASGVRNDTQTSTMEAECKLNDKRMNSVLAPVYASYWKNTRVDLYRAIAKAYADVKPECLGYYAGARYSTDKDGFGSTLFNKIARLGSRFPELLTDPGIVFRLDEFISFATPQAAAEPDPWKMRTAFAEHLESTQGALKLCRGLALPDEATAKQIAAEGMSSGFYRSVYQKMSAILNPEGDSSFVFPMAGFPVSNTEFAFHALFTNHVRDASGSPFVSVSAQEDICAGVATLSRGKVFIFSLSLNPLDAWSFSSTLPVPQDWRHTFEKEVFCITPPNGNISCRKNSPDVESFVFYKIEPKEIVGVKEVTSPPKFETR